MFLHPVQVFSSHTLQAINQDRARHSTKLPTVLQSFKNVYVKWSEYITSPGQFVVLRKTVVKMAAFVYPPGTVLILLPIPFFPF